jgi:hypothetical protein|tara:strand:+ start:1115 stop:1486 length:372 start_codon:yes stop_codon:yes gene_type:complete
MSKICRRCGTGRLEWNKKHHEKTKKWQLEDHKTKEGKWCLRNNIQIEKKIETIILCEYCKESNFGLCRSEKDYKAHIKAYHPNKEILTTLDYMFLHCGLKGVNLESWKSDSHYKNYKRINNII